MTDLTILEKLVALIPEMALFLVLMVVVGTIVYYTLLPRETESPEIKDLHRIAREIKQLEKYEKEFLVPVTGKDYELFLFEKESDDSPSICNKKACICLFNIKNKQLNLNECETFEDIYKKGEGAYFVKSQTAVTDQGEVKISRDGDAISIIS